MANDLSNNPWFLDTASANYLRSGSTVPWPRQQANAGNPPSLSSKGGPVHVMSFVWTGYTDATHKAIVKDQDGNAIFTFDGNSDLSPISFNFTGLHTLRIWDFALTTLNSGVVAVALG